LVPRLSKVPAVAAPWGSPVQPIFRVGVRILTKQPGCPASKKHQKAMLIYGNDSYWILDE